MRWKRFGFLVGIYSNCYRFRINHPINCVFILPVCLRDVFMDPHLHPEGSMRGPLCLRASVGHETGSASRSIISTNPIVAVNSMDSYSRFVT